MEPTGFRTSSIARSRHGVSATGTRRCPVALPDIAAVPGAGGISGAGALAWIGICLLTLHGVLPRRGIDAGLAQISGPDVDQVPIAGGQHGGGIAGPPAALPGARPGTCSLARGSANRLSEPVQKGPADRL
jgi:hypothetical protein